MPDTDAKKASQQEMLRHLTCASSHVQSAYVAAAGDHELRAKLHAIGVNISSAIRTVIEERTT